jgi:hypothetical protein
VRAVSAAYADGVGLSGTVVVADIESAAAELLCAGGLEPHNVRLLVREASDNAGATGHRGVATGMRASAPRFGAEVKARAERAAPVPLPRPFRRRDGRRQAGTRPRLPTALHDIGYRKKCKRPGAGRGR